MPRIYYEIMQYILGRIYKEPPRVLGKEEIWDTNTESENLHQKNVGD